MVGWDGIEPPTPGFQSDHSTLPGRSDWTSSVSIREIPRLSHPDQYPQCRMVSNGTGQVRSKSPPRVRTVCLAALKYQSRVRRPPPSLSVGSGAGPLNGCSHNQTLQGRECPARVRVTSRLRGNSSEPAPLPQGHGPLRLSLGLAKGRTTISRLE
jgi:hypothetical protein